MFQFFATSSKNSSETCSDSKSATSEEESATSETKSTASHQQQQDSGKSCASPATDSETAGIDSITAADLEEVSSSNPVDNDDLGEAHINLLQSDNEGSSVASSSDSFSSSSSSPDSTDNDKQKTTNNVSITHDSDSPSSTTTKKNSSDDKNKHKESKTLQDTDSQSNTIVNNNKTKNKQEFTELNTVSGGSPSIEEQQLKSEKDEKIRQIQLSKLDGALPFLYCVEPDSKNSLVQYFQQDSNIEFYFQMLIDSYYIYARHSSKIQAYLKSRYLKGNFAGRNNDSDDGNLDEMDDENKEEVEQQECLDINETLQYAYQGYDELDYYYNNVILQRNVKPYDQKYEFNDYDRKHIQHKFHDDHAEESGTSKANKLFTAENLAKMSDSNIDLDQDQIFLERCSTIADIYSSDTPKIADALLSNKKHLLLLWSILEKDFLYEMHPLLVSFVKINQCLLLNNADEYLNFIRSNINLVDLFVKHNVDILLLNEFLMKLIITDKNNMHTGIIDLLMEQDLIQHMINLIDVKYPFYISEFVGDMIKSLVGISVLNLQQGSDETIAIGSNNLTRELVTHKSIWKMAVKIKDGGKSASILIDIIIEIIRKNNCDYGDFNLLIFAKYKKFLDELIVNDSEKPKLNENVEKHNETFETNNSQDDFEGTHSADDVKRSEFNDLMNQFPPSDREPIYLNNILKIFSLNIPWLCNALQENLGYYPDDFIFDSSKIDYFLLDKDPVSQLESKEIQDAIDKKFLKDKIYVAQSFGYIEKFTMFKLKLTELVAELLHCSNIKLYNHKDAQWLIESRNQLISSRTKFLNDAITDKLSLLSFETSNTINQEVSLPISANIQVNSIPGINVFSKKDEKSSQKNQSCSSTHLIAQANGNVEYSNDEADTNNMTHENITDLTDEERRIKKDKMVSKLVLNINPEMNTKTPAPQKPVQVGKPDLPKIDTSKSAISKVTDARHNPLREDNKENEMRKSEENGGFTTNNNCIISDVEDSFIFDDIDDFAAVGEFLSPFVCATNEKALIENPTLGDEFKYQLHQHKLLDLIIKHICFRFPWNNFLHTVVYDVIQQLLSGTMTGNYNAFLVSDLFFMANITDLLYSVAHKNELFLQKFKIEFACMGHVNLITDEIMRFVSSYELDAIDPAILDTVSTDKWIEFLNQLLNVVKCNFEEEEINGNENDREGIDDDIDDDYDDDEEDEEDEDDEDDEDDDDDSIFRDPDSIILGATESDILNQDLKLSNPKKLKKLNRDSSQNGNHNEETEMDEIHKKGEKKGPKNVDTENTDYTNEEFELPVYLKG